MLNYQQEKYGNVENSIEQRGEEIEKTQNNKKSRNKNTVVQRESKRFSPRKEKSLYRTKEEQPIKIT